jgi:hypothetical protein
MSKKIILAGFACLLLFLVSVAKSDPNKQQAPRPAVALDVAPRPATINVRRVRKDHQSAPAVKKKIDKSNRQ